MKRTRIIAVDNDGGDIFHSKDASYDEFIKARLTPLIGTGTTTLLYTTQSSGFSVFSHPTKYGSLYTTFEEMYPGNCAGDIIKNGSDCLKYASRFCRENGIDIYWNFRMNDTHDGYRVPEQNRYAYSMFARNQLKHDHPEYMIGTLDNIPKYGSWTAVDYARDEIRELAYKYVEEILNGWDVDGISLDFFRHPVFFKETGNGEPVTTEHVELMTGLVKRIADLVHSHGKGVWVRVPDSVAYAKFIGLDIERWLSEDLIDQLCTTSYLQMEDWSQTAKLAHKYGVQAVASLDECRIQDKTAQKLRMENEGWLARASEAFGKGMDGVMFFNLIVDKADEPERYSYILSTTSSEEKLANAKKRFFVSYRGFGAVAGGAPNHREYQRIPILNPNCPLPSSKSLSIRVDTPGDSAQSFTVYVRLGKKNQYSIRCKNSSSDGFGDMIMLPVHEMTGDHVDIDVDLAMEGEVIDCYIETNGIY